MLAGKQKLVKLIPFVGASPQKKPVTRMCDDIPQGFFKTKIY